MYLFFTVVNMFLLILTYCQLAQTNSLLATLVTIMMLRYNECDDKCECEDSDEEDSDNNESEDEISEDTDCGCEQEDVPCDENNECDNDESCLIKEGECGNHCKDDENNECITECCLVKENDNEQDVGENKSLNGLIKSTLQDIMSGGKKNIVDDKGQLREDLIGSVFSRISAFSKANPEVMEETEEMALNELASKGLSYVNSMSALMDLLPASSYYTPSQVQQVKERLDDMKTTMCDVIDTGDYTNLEQVLEESTRTLTTIVEENDLLVRNKV